MKADFVFSHYVRNKRYVIYSKGLATYGFVVSNDDSVALFRFSEAEPAWEVELTTAVTMEEPGGDSRAERLVRKYIQRHEHINNWYKFEQRRKEGG